MKTTLFAISLLISSCSLFISKLDEGKTYKIEKRKKFFSILYSHNINGETHPCGCRHFPLGGLPQVAGLISKVSKESQVIYVDTGDALFPLATVPKEAKDSQTYNATELAFALKRMGISHMTPGDQDLALGDEFLDKLELPYLLSNIDEQRSKLRHHKFAMYESGPNKFFLLGVTSPISVKRHQEVYFKNAINALDEAVKILKNNGYDQEDKFHRLVLLSHSGGDKDQEIAEKIPEFDWILGAHSQDFTEKPNVVGKTKIVQVLSKNHYMGEVRFSLEKGKIEDRYIQHTVKEHLEKELKPNPFTDFIQAHKEKIQKVQMKEQQIDYSQTFAKQMKTSSSCIECHTKQGEKWKSTPHSLAYITLIQNKEQYNTQCIGCHSVGFQDKAGFRSISKIIDFEKEHPKTHKENYWSEVSKIFSKTESIRALPSSTITKLSNKWEKLDKRFEVSKNFSNVQCLNCHSKHLDHPFDMASTETSKEERLKFIKSKCLSCHTHDQSPQWYDKKKVIGKKFSENIKKVACPSRKDL